MMEDEYTMISKHLLFDNKTMRFCLDDESTTMLYDKKELITSYSGCHDWAHHFFCEIIDFYGGMGPYNYALGTYSIQDELEKASEQGDRKKRIVEWLEKNFEKPWFKKAAEAFDTLMENAPWPDD